MIASQLRFICIINTFSLFSEFLESEFSGSRVKSVIIFNELESNFRIFLISQLLILDWEQPSIYAIHRQKSVQYTDSCTKD